MATSVERGARISAGEVIGLAPAQLQGPPHTKGKSRACYLQFLDKMLLAGANLESPKQVCFAVRPALFRNKTFSFPKAGKRSSPSGIARSGSQSLSTLRSFNSTTLDSPEHSCNGDSSFTASSYISRSSCCSSQSAVRKSYSQEHEELMRRTRSGEEEFMMFHLGCGRSGDLGGLPLMRMDSDGGGKLMTRLSGLPLEQLDEEDEEGVAAAVAVVERAGGMETGGEHLLELILDAADDFLRGTRCDVPTHIMMQRISEAADESFGGCGLSSFSKEAQEEGEEEVAEAGCSKEEEEEEEEEEEPGGFRAASIVRPDSEEQEACSSGAGTQCFLSQEVSPLPPAHAMRTVLSRLRIATWPSSSESDEGGYEDSDDIGCDGDAETPSHKCGASARGSGGGELACASASSEACPPALSRRSSCPRNPWAPLYGPPLSFMLAAKLNPGDGVGMGLEREM